MIVDTILGFISTVLGAVFNLLPSWSIVSDLGLPTPGSGDVTGHLAGGYVGQFDGIFPFHELFDLILAAATVLLAAYAIYKIANWAWRHFPDIGGFGPGAG